MSSVLSLARVSFLELIRDKFVVVSVFIALLLVGISLILGSMSFDEHRRLLLHFGLLAIHLSSLGIVIFLGAASIPKEIERQTCLMVLIRPVSRMGFIFGKYFGILALNLVVNFGLAAVLYGLLGFSVPFGNFFVCVLGIVIESATLLAFVLMMSLWLKPVVALFSGISLFLMGHWQPDLFYFAEKSKYAGFILLSKIVPYSIPQFYRLNFRSIDLVDGSGLTELLPQAAMNSLAWLGIYIIVAGALFRRKDLV